MLLGQLTRSITMLAGFHLLQKPECERQHPKPAVAVYNQRARLNIQ